MAFPSLPQGGPGANDCHQQKGTATVSQHLLQFAGYTFIGKASLWTSKLSLLVRYVSAPGVPLSAKGWILSRIL